MRVSALEARHLQRLSALCRKLGLRKAFITRPIDAWCVLLLGNGVPDDLALTIVCSALDHERTVVFARPLGKRLGAVEYIRVLSEKYPATTRFLLTIDQEEEPLNQLWGAAGSKLREHFEVMAECGDHKWRLFECRVGEKKLAVGITLNGLGEWPWSKHAIEDHFLRAAKSIKAIPNEIAKLMKSSNFDPKRTWLDRLKTIHDGVFRELVRRKRLVEESFPQHVATLRALAGEARLNL